MPNLFSPQWFLWTACTLSICNSIFYSYIYNSIWSTNKVVVVVVVAESGLCWLWLCWNFDCCLSLFFWAQCLLQVDTFDILKFSVIVSLRGHKQTMFVHVYSISLFVISKTRYRPEFWYIESSLFRGAAV